jgi:hypothetical protein
MIVSYDIYLNSKSGAPCTVPVHRFPRTNSTAGALVQGTFCASPWLLKTIHHTPPFKNIQHTQLHKIYGKYVSKKNKSTAQPTLNSNKLYLPRRKK